MSRGWLAAPAAALVLLAFPASGAQAAGSLHAAFSDLGSLHASLDGQYTAGDAVTQRRSMDGDGDGTVTAAEVAASIDRTMALLAGRGRMGLPIGRLFLDGNASSQTDIDGLSYSGAEGAVEGGPTLGQHWSVTLHFHPGPGPMHLFRVDPGNFSAAGHINLIVNMLTLEAPPGYRFNATGGLPLHAAANADGTVVTLPTGMADVHGWMDFELAPKPLAAASPGPAPVLVVAALALASWRRRA